MANTPDKFKIGDIVAPTYGDAAWSKARVVKVTHESLSYTRIDYLVEEVTKVGLSIRVGEMTHDQDSSLKLWTTPRTYKFKVGDIVQSGSGRKIKIIGLRDDYYAYKGCRVDDGYTDHWNMDEGGWKLVTEPVTVIMDDGTKLPLTEGMLRSYYNYNVCLRKDYEALTKETRKLRDERSSPEFVADGFANVCVNKEQLTRYIDLYRGQLAENMRLAERIASARKTLG